MKVWILKQVLTTAVAVALTLVIVPIVLSQVFGPAGDAPYVGPGPTPPATSVRTLCLGSFGCLPVSYATVVGFTTATVTLPNGFPIAGISGACLPGWDCPAIKDDADRDLAVRVSQAHRLQRYLGQ